MKSRSSLVPLKNNTTTEEILDEYCTGTGQRKEERGTRKEERGRRNETVVGGGRVPRASNIVDDDFVSRVVLVTGLVRTRSNIAHILRWRDHPWDALEIAFAKVSYQRSKKGEDAPRSAKYFDAAIENETKELSRVREKLGVGTSLESDRPGSDDEQ